MTSEEIIQRYKTLRTTSAERSYSESTAEYINLIYECKQFYQRSPEETEESRKVAAINIWSAMYVLGLKRPSTDGKPNLQHLLDLAEELAK